MRPLDRTRVGTFLTLGGWSSTRPFAEWQVGVLARVGRADPATTNVADALDGIERAAEEIGGWAALAEQAIDPDDDGIHDALFVVAEMGARAHAAALEVRARLGEAQR